MFWKIFPVCCCISISSVSCKIAESFSFNIWYVQKHTHTHDTCIMYTCVCMYVCTDTIRYMFRMLILMGADSTRQTLQNLLYCWMDTAEGTPVNTQNVTVCVCSVLQYLIVNFWSMPFTIFEFANFYLFGSVCVCVCSFWAVWYCYFRYGCSRFYYFPNLTPPIHTLFFSTNLFHFFALQFSLGITLFFPISLTPTPLCLILFCNSVCFLNFT